MTTIEDQLVLAALTEAADRVAARPMPFDRIPRVHARARRRRRVRGAGSVAVIAALVGAGWAALPLGRPAASPVLPAGARPAPTQQESLRLGLDVTWDKTAKEATVEVRMDGMLHEYVDLHTFEPISETEVDPAEVSVEWGDLGETLGGSPAGGCSTQTPLRPVRQVASRTHRYPQPGRYVVKVAVFICSRQEPIRAERTITVP